MIRVKIQNLRLRTYIGFNEAEQKNRQDVVINIEFCYPKNDARFSDDVTDAVNYRTISKQVITLVEDGRFMLLEKLCQSILDQVQDNPGITSARVEVEKPHALRFADSVSVALEYQNQA
ncbi:dihydroneopterin triphosphate 2'-epimerase [Pelagibaculum spongiae]|uniref:Dihydroneopterin triphosphate 2'-epimerase n=1 Tax=Pelagibaculum spongiae TaxID=2080658 RepID=A0A2V1H1Y6_9GAMM|nr:dihydroneopterin triphosphate 2'-epimerase [Pelagibaculum spongiae]PVZ70452.1 dihydroneopterin triphosphate 2'-epimerase [Pelagibaculum spongiae]